MIGWTPTHTRRFLFALLYFSEGAPIGYAWWALPTQLRASGVDLGTITLLSSSLAVPWALKALWAPLIDTYRGPAWGYRSWILAAQVSMGLSLVPLAIVGPASVLWLTFFCLLCHALFAATQDVAIDALCISVLPAHERGRANGWMQAGMLLGRAAFGGGTLVLLSIVGERGTILLLIGVIWCIAAIVGRSRMLSTDPERSSARSEGIGSIITAFRTLLRRRYVLYALGFALLSGSVFEGLGAVTGPLFIDTGLTTEDSGFFFGIPAIAGMTIGALLGGTMSDRFGAARTVRRSFLLLCGLVAGLGLGLLTGMVGADRLTASLSVVYAGIGVFTASSYALFMENAVEEYRATSFSAYMGATNLCESWSAMTIGRLVPSLGYGSSFILMACISLPSLFFLHRLHAVRRTEDS